MVSYLYGSSLSPLSPSMSSSSGMSLLPGPSPLQVYDFAVVPLGLEQYTLESRRCCTGDQWLVVCYSSEWCHGHRHIPYVGISGPCCCILTGSLSESLSQKQRLSCSASTLFLDLFMMHPQWASGIASQYFTLFLCNSTFSAPRNILDGRSWLDISVLVNFGFSSSTVAVLCEHLFRMELRLWGLDISVRIHPSRPCMPGCQCAALLSAVHPVRQACSAPLCSAAYFWDVPLDHHKQHLTMEHLNK